MTGKLKPCPFCGSSDIRTDDGKRDRGSVWCALVECQGCSALMEDVAGTLDVLVRKWNARAPVAVQSHEPTACISVPASTVASTLDAPNAGPEPACMTHAPLRTEPVAWTVGHHDMYGRDALKARVAELEEAQKKRGHEKFELLNIQAALSRRIAELKAALRPFAAEAVQWGESWDDNYRPECIPSNNIAGLTDNYQAKFSIGDLRHAAKLLEK